MKKLIIAIFSLASFTVFAQPGWRSASSLIGPIPSANLATNTGTDGQALTKSGNRAKWATVSGGSGQPASANLTNWSSLSTNVLGSMPPTNGLDLSFPVSLIFDHGTNKCVNGPKIYRALLTQTGTDAPVATVLENSLGGAVVWSYDNPGLYSGTLLGAFPQTKIFLVFNNLNWDGNSTSTFAPGENANLVVLTIAAGDSFINANAPAYVQILVYPP
jgi:hypothetical protein